MKVNDNLSPHHVPDSVSSMSQGNFWVTVLCRQNRSLKRLAIERVHGVGDIISTTADRLRRPMQQTHALDLQQLALPKPHAYRTRPRHA